MSFVFVGLIGAVTGLLAGVFLTGSREEIVVDMIAGAVGAWVTVVLCRVILPEIAGGAWMSAIVGVIGAIVMLFAMNRFLGGKLMSASWRRRR